MNWDPQQLRDAMKNNPALRTGNNRAVLYSLAEQLKKKPSKYHNNKIEVDGIIWDSHREYNHWCELRLLEAAGVISGLRRQVKFFLDEETATGRTKYLRVDFVYEQEGKLVLDDTKGYPDPNWTEKWKKLQRKYPEYRFVIS